MTEHFGAGRRYFLGIGNGAVVHPQNDILPGGMVGADRNRNAAFSRNNERTGGVESNSGDQGSSTPAMAIALRTALQTASQISLELCWANSGRGLNVVIAAEAVPRRIPLRSKTPARALPVPTSIPMKHVMGLVGPVVTRR
jgi:hypothetical protein